MSFSSGVKDELCRRQCAPCCRAAMLYGMLQTGRSFDGRAISLMTEHDAVASLYTRLLGDVCGVENVLRTDREGGAFSVTVPDEADRRRILDRFGHTQKEVSRRLNRANLECDECPSAYLAGAFLSCGAITDPEADYHLEFHLPHHNLSRDILTLLREVSLSPKLADRKGNRVIYFKESEQVEDCLTMMGASSSSLELMGIKMVKDIRNNANRVANCTTANIDKTVAAAKEQMRAIRLIQEKGMLESLPPQLKELALLRLEEPELSLRELGESLSKPLTRSGVNHRLRRIQEIAEDLQ